MKEMKRNFLLYDNNGGYKARRRRAMFNELKSFHLKNKKSIIMVMMSHYELPYALIEFRLCESV